MGFILAILLIEIMGLAFMLLAVRHDRYEYSLIELFSLSFLLGVGFISFQLLIYSILGIKFTFLNVITVPAVLFILVFSRYAAKPERARDFITFKGKIHPLSWVEKLLILGIAIQFLWVLALTIPVPVSSHDAVANYALKAKIFYFSQGIPEGFISWPEATVSHPDYPPLLSFVMTWIYIFTGFNDLTVKLVMPLLYLFFMGVFYSALKRIFSRKFALLVTFLLATIPQLFDYATIMYADLPLAAFVACGLSYFLLYLKEKRGAEFVIASLFFSFALLTKNEGLAFAGLFLFLIFILLLKSSGRERIEAFKMIVSFSLLVLIIAGPWFYMRISAGAVNSDIDLSSITLSRVLQNVKDIPVLLNLFQQEVFGPKKWNIFWVIFFTSLVWRRKKVWKGECFYLMLFITLSTLGYFTGYMLTTGNNLYFYVNTTISRFMIHFAPLAALAVAFLTYDDVTELQEFRREE